jgi:hypothetical protein
MRGLLPAALLLAGCSGRPDLLEHDVDPGKAIRVEILDDLTLVDGNPVADDQLVDAIAVARLARGEGKRSAAFVSVALLAREGEAPLDFDARLQRRKNDVLDRLVQAGVRDLQFGPPGDPAAPAGSSKR